MCIKHTVKRACPTVGTRLEDIALLLNLIPIKIKLLPCCGDWFSKIIALLWGKLSRMLAPLKYNNIKFLKLGACPVGCYCIVCGAMVVSLSAPHRADVNRRALGVVVACCRVSHSEQLSPHKSHIYLSIKPNFRTYKSFLKPQDPQLFFLTK